MAKKKIKKAPAGMHKMPGGMMMGDKEMEKHQDEMMSKYKSRIKTGKYRR